ncbi:hypothetical protein NIA69_16770 [Gemmiger formicilis]|nr:hypothetical protein [Gemmiger formicilis]
MALDLIAAALAGGRTTRQVGELPLETELSQVFICIDLDSLPDKENIAANVEATLRDMETSTPWKRAARFISPARTWPRSAATTWRTVFLSRKQSGSRCWHCKERCAV